MRLSETLEIDNNFLSYFADGMDLLHKSPESQFWGIVSIGTGMAARRWDNGRCAVRLLCGGRGAMCGARRRGGLEIQGEEVLNVLPLLQALFHGDEEVHPSDHPLDELDLQGKSG